MVSEPAAVTQAVSGVTAQAVSEHYYPDAPEEGQQKTFVWCRFLEMTRH
jgi:hypothetical protein